jgi:methyltransferase (TIGR00027 family)
MTARTAFVDDEVVSAIGRGTEQFVIVGAGYDGRALRFGVAGTRWFEVDHPATQPDKRRRLSSLGARTDHVSFVPVDLLTDDVADALDEAGHDPRRPTLFICEGLFSYLPVSAGASLCAALHARGCPESRLVANFRVADLSRRPGLQRAVDAVLAALGERRQSNYAPGDPEQMLGTAGWATDRRGSTKPNRAAGDSHLLLVAAAHADPV